MPTDYSKIPLPPGFSQDEFEEAMAQCGASLKAHCLMFHGSEPDEEDELRFTAPFSKSHEAFFEVWDDPSVKYILVKAHRGWGKTSLLGLGGPSQAIIHQTYPFVVYVGATLEGGAQLQTENLKKALTQTDTIKAVIGEVESDRFSKDIWETSNGSLVFPRGRGQQVRGVLHNNRRPNLIIADDLEDEDSVASKEAVDKTVKYFYADLMGTVDRAKGNFRIVVIGTILSHDCLPVRLASDSMFTVLDFPLCDSKTFVSNWPERFNENICKEIYNQYTSSLVGRPDIFAREYLNQPAMEADLVFKKEYFRYFSTQKGTKDKYGNDTYYLDLNSPHIETFVMVDPAKTSTTTSDWTAIVGVSIEFTPRGNRIFVRDVIKKKMLPDEIYEEAFGMADRLGTRTMGWEFNSLNEFLRQPLQDFMARRRRMYELVDLKPRQATGDYVTKYKGKEGRVAMMAPYYRIGAVYHDTTGSAGPLEEQLLRFPHTSEWDVMDAFAYFPQMLAAGGRTFSPEADNELHARQMEDLEGEDLEMERELERMDAEDELMDEFDDSDEVSYIG